MTFILTVACASPSAEWKRNVAEWGPIERLLVLAVTMMDSPKPFVPSAPLLVANVNQFVFEPPTVADQSRLAPPWLFNVTESLIVLPTPIEPKLRAVGLTAS